MAKRKRNTNTVSDGTPGEVANFCVTIAKNPSGDFRVVVADFEHTFPPFKENSKRKFKVACAEAETSVGCVPIIGAMILGALKAANFSGTEDLESMLDKELSSSAETPSQE